MRSNAHRSTPLLPLTLAFMISGLLGCSGGSEARQGEAAKPADSAQAQPAAPTAQSPGAMAPASPLAPGQIPGQPSGQPPAEPKVDPAALPVVVAKVDGKEIKKDALLEEAKQLRGQFLQRGARPEQLEGQTFYRQVLDGIVSRVLVENEARAAGTVVSDADIDKEMTALRGRFPNPEAFNKALAQQGMDEAKLKDNFKRQLLVSKFVEEKVFPKDGVSEQEQKAFYDQNQDKMQEPERLHLRHILVRVPEGAPEADKQKAREKAEGLLAKAKAGEDFAKLASENSDDPGSKVKGGDLSWIARGQTVEPFEKAAFALQKPNELSPVVETRFGYHVIQLLEHKAAGVAPYEQVKDRIGAFLKQQKSQQQFQAHLQELRTKAKVETFI